MRLETQITIQRPDGSTEIVTRPGHITSLDQRRKMTAATKQAGRGDIIKWQTTTRYAKQQGCRLYTREQGCPLHGETCENAY